MKKAVFHKVMGAIGDDGTNLDFALGGHPDAEGSVLTVPEASIDVVVEQIEALGLEVVQLAPPPNRTAILDIREPTTEGGTKHVRPSDVMVARDIVRYFFNLLVSYGTRDHVEEALADNPVNERYEPQLPSELRDAINLWIAQGNKRFWEDE
jgi:hypothetical protein